MGYKMNIGMIKILVDYYGEGKQLEKTKEELQELINEIEVYQKKGKRDGLVGEIADALNMIARTIYIADLNFQDITTAMEYKMNRQRIRMQDELARKNCSTCRHAWLIDEEYPCCSCKNHNQWEGK